MLGDMLLYLKKKKLNASWVIGGFFPPRNIWNTLIGHLDVQPQSITFFSVIWCSTKIQKQRASNQLDCVSFYVLQIWEELELIYHKKNL